MKVAIGISGWVLAAVLALILVINHGKDGTNEPHLLENHAAINASLQIRHPLSYITSLGVPIVDDRWKGDPRVRVLEAHWDEAERVVVERLRATDSPKEALYFTHLIAEFGLLQPPDALDGVLGTWNPENWPESSRGEVSLIRSTLRKILNEGARFRTESQSPPTANKTLNPTSDP